MGIVQTPSRLLAVGFLALPLALASGARQSAQSTNEQAQNYDTPGQSRKSAPKVWTNDDFPSEPAVPANRGEVPAKNQTPPKNSAALPESPSNLTSEEAKLAKMTPKARKEQIEVDEADIRYEEETLPKLRQSLYEANDSEKYQSIVKKIKDLERLTADSRHELEILRSIPPDQPARKDSEKNPGTTPTEPPAPETTPPTNQL